MGFGAVLLGLFVWALNVPAWHANAFRAKVAVGQTLGQVAAATAGAGRVLVFVAKGEGTPDLLVGEGTARVGSERAEGADAVRGLLDRHAAALRVERLSFMFLGPVPTRSTVVVRFGPDGHAAAVEGPFHRAD